VGKVILKQMVTLTLSCQINLWKLLNLSLKLLGFYNGIILIFNQNPLMRYKVRAERCFNAISINSY